MVVRDAGLIEYREALTLQESLVLEVQQGGAETLLLVEHHPVYTIGAAGDESNVLDPSIEAHRVNRGGDVTYHGPGQLVGYPILDLGRRGRDLHRYLRFLECFLIDLCGGLGVQGFTIPGKTGVWTSSGKIAAIGVGVRRWVSMHGFSLNAAADMSPFGNINPCGMPECRITSLTLERRQEITVKELKALAAERFETLLESHLPRS
ncbi:lipoyl(octanoyl) transferase LipB [Geomonas propionica]|uniref:Octanoyltransferase n=1 Tax=Geomonas propionica TaxID=2798582 RepID=A0ABS0YNW0_9BACT|nr:lipoyl(octanoyl) transferase LipB [Geomonas propionica]MBJ6799639.1 lipoyl(octanoyl) transferase LipB [Geomonas propionica]